MDNKKNGIPKLRFPGFTGAWEQRKLGGVAKFYSGGTPSVGVSDYYDGTIPFIRSAEINSTSTELYLSELGLQNSSAKMVHRGDILYALYGATSGEVGISKINGAINQAILAIIPHKGYNSEFLEQWLRKNKEAIIKTYLQGGQGNLSGAIVKQIKVSFPSFDEQQKIGKSFQKIDSLITLHQRKLEHLQEQKKGLLQKMFPKNGETVPEVRFPGFTDAWEQRKLGEYFPNILSGNRLPKTMIVKGDVPYVIATTENNGVGAYLSENQKDYSNNNMKKFDRNSITVSIDNPEAIFIQTKTFVASNVMRVLHNSKLDFDELNFFKQILKIKAKGFDWSSKFSGPVIKNISFFAPSDNKEMQKIGKVITNLDSLIALHQRKLDHLELMKKGLLQQMFV